MDLLFGIKELAIDLVKDKYSSLVLGNMNKKIKA